MIRYALTCQEGHAFESWFRNSADFDDQAARRFVTCPVCGSEKVKKALMTPRLGLSSKLSPAQMIAAAGGVMAEMAPADSSRSCSPMPGEELPDGGVPVSDTTVPPVTLMSPQETELRRKLKELREHLVRNSEYVRERFPDEARRMHYGEIERRSIYGKASPDEVKEMLEEGIEFHPLPILPDERN